MKKLDKLYYKIYDGARIYKDEVVELLKYGDLNVLGELANRIRFAKNPKNIVTFVVDTNPNYTNICISECLFCAFYRRKGDKDAYLLSVDEVVEKARRAYKLGATTLLLQGGLNPDVSYGYYIELVKRLREALPNMHLHLFSAPEIDFMAKISGKSYEEVLSELYNLGLRTIPGGGAEILSDRVRKIIAPKKIDSKTWLDIHRIAHNIGFKTTATMMYGSLEDYEDIAEHLNVIRNLQDETNGFTAFIYWSFKPKNTMLYKRVRYGKGYTEYLRMTAISRIYLDNFSHIQASWFSEGKKVGSIALHYGADDFGGVLIEENVLKSADFVNISSIEEVKSIIRDAGFIPAERNTLYEILKVFAEKTS